ncbi:zinc ribbon family protein [Natranaerovirga pectinivora]|uniref:Zinc ribbon family protein n=1 Tax=Natranaerovirga pectinivora TaxID=682400 RepID=A0A4R3ML34_9FIRM|nr:zinc-ribbon domain-containing protein [Natranaerovirga pectinivora]TCT15318.1 zinc ribbon family protein [Natranaerovirga pectinivora]
MFIVGWGYRTFKKYSKITSNCLHCDNVSMDIDLIKVTIWFTFFFVPIIPTSKRYLLMCSKCKGIEEVDKDTFFDYVNEKEKPESVGNIEALEASKWRGKTETQINYLKEMEAFKKKKEENTL